MGKARSLARQFADLKDRTPLDFDPEEDGPAEQSDEESNSEESDDGLAGTEHYAAVGKSKLRKAGEVTLGPEYDGSRISRTALLDGNEGVEESESESNSENDLESGDETYADPEALDFEVDDEDGDIDSENALGESDLERFEAFTFRGSSKPKKSNGIKKRPTAADFMSDSEAEAMSLNGHQSAASETDEDILDINTQHSEASEDDGESVQGMDVDDESDEDDSADEIDEGNSGSEDDSQSESGDDDDKGRRAELRKIMSEEQKSVVATISEAAKADAQKGSAVRQQRKAFDSLLSVRMVMQKALIASNSMAAVDDKESEDSINQPYEAAEEAAIKLWNTLEGMRYELSKTANTTTGQKRKREVDVSASSSTIWDRMKKSEVSMIHNRQATLEKWSSKVRGSTSLPLTRRLNPTGPEQSITSLLQDQLATSEHLIKRTKMPRSCAPIQRDQKLVEDPNIYDDGNFYQMLLKELVDQRRVESLTAPAAGNDANNTMQWVAVKEAKTRKNVDTKASKGRKMRFTVHEKLQNFMAPDDRATWEPERIDRFFGTLLGQKMNLVEDEVSDEENDVPEEDEGLMLFRS